jgi:hypothetical protein
MLIFSGLPGAVNSEPVIGWTSTRWQLAATPVFAVLVTGGLAAATRLARTAEAINLLTGVLATLPVALLPHG